MITLKNKRAAEMTIGTIVVIILALVVLVFLIFAFARGGGNLMDYVTNLFGGSSNIDTIKNVCNAACAAQAQFAFCEEARTLRYDKDTTYKGSCATLSDKGIEACGGLSCSAAPKKCGDASIGGTWSVNAKCVSPKVAVTSQVGDSEGNNIKKDYCCK